MFITLEGLDGSGKTTVLETLKSQLPKLTDREIVITREPGGSPMAEKLRQLFLHDEAISPITESLMVASGRADHVDKVIKPAIERGALVISDRFFDSSVAYQGGARGAGFNQVLQINLWAVQNVMPDLTFFIDTKPSVSISRIDPDPDRLESFGLELQTKARIAYNKLFTMYPDRYIVFPVGMTLAEISQQILKILHEKLA
ncbi:MAG: dTMP kinase [Bifidobacteriaceae bacterium]|jgi:dTMP kinase|nr:dTMP kinase [Bifidobacteriaceae bacterium]